MVQIIFWHSEFMIPVLILLFLSIICQISIGVLYHRLIRQTENMSATKSKSLQQLKLKFSSCCKLHEGVSNVPVFVDKYIHRIKIGWFPLSALRHLSGQLILLSILIAGLGACRSIIAGESFIYIVPYYIISFLGLYCYFAISSLVDISGKTELLRVNLIDYLENHFEGRLGQTALDLKLVSGEADSKPDKDDSVLLATFADSSSQIVSDSEENLFKQEKIKASSTFSPGEAKELEALLREFLA